MTTKFKALIGFSGLKEDGLVVAATTIVNAMTGNANYPDPSPTLESIQALLDDFSSKLAACRRRGSPEDTALKDESRPLLEAGLQKLAYYVNSVANGSLSVLLSSGFPTNGKSSSLPVPLMVEGIKLSDGRQSGQLRLDFVREKGAKIYEYRYRLADTGDAGWSDRLSTTSSRGNIIAPLLVGQTYEVQVRALNTKGVGDWSQTASILVR